MSNTQKRLPTAGPVLCIDPAIQPTNLKAGPQGLVRTVAGPHSLLFGRGPRSSPNLTYRLKVVEPGTARIVSSTPISSWEEALAAIKLLGSSDHQGVLVNQSSARFIPRAR